MKKQKSISKEKKWIKMFMIFILILSQSTHLFSQQTLNIKVVDPLGRRVEGINITFEDKQNLICPVATTNVLGTVSFQVQQIPQLVFAYDNRETPLYGATSLNVNQSLNQYVIVIPFAPKNEKEMAVQINNIYETVRTAHGYYSTADFIQKTLRGIESKAGMLTGVPGIFSISPLPKFEDGKPYLVVSGVLVDFIFNFSRRLMQYPITSIQGQDAIFQHNYHSGIIKL